MILDELGNVTKFGRDESNTTASVAQRSISHLHLTATQMDIAADTAVITEEFSETLNYDEVPYEEQLPSLAERISKNKLYLLEDASIAKGSKVRALPRSPTLPLMLRDVAQT